MIIHRQLCEDDKQWKIMNRTAGNTEYRYASDFTTEQDTLFSISLSPRKALDHKPPRNVRTNMSWSSQSLSHKQTRRARKERTEEERGLSRIPLPRGIMKNPMHPSLPPIQCDLDGNVGGKANSDGEDAARL